MLHRISLKILKEIDGGAKFPKSGANTFNPSNIKKFEEKTKLSGEFKIHNEPLNKNGVVSNYVSSNNGKMLFFTVLVAQSVIHFFI